MDDFQSLSRSADRLRYAGTAIVILASIIGLAGLITVIWSVVQIHRDVDLYLTIAISSAFSTALTVSLLLAAGFAAQTMARASILRLVMPAAGSRESERVRALI